MAESYSVLTAATDPQKRWHVAVGGRWNRAIFTPAGISKRIFGLPPGHMMKLEVSADTVAPIRVTHDDITVWVADERLVIEASSNTVPALAKAIALARAAIAELPETPFLGAGFMLAFGAPAATNSLARYWTPDCDKKLSDEGFAVTGRVFSRTVSWRDGEITIVASQKGNTDYEAAVVFNRSSTESSDLRKWLSVGAEEIEVEVQKLTRALLS